MRLSICDCVRKARFAAALFVGGVAACSSASALDAGAYRCSVLQSLIVEASGGARNIDSNIREFALYAYGAGDSTELSREAPGPSLQVHGEEIPAVAIRIGAALFAAPSNLMTSDDARVFVQAGASISFTQEGKFVATGPSPQSEGASVIVYIGACERRR